MAEVTAHDMGTYWRLVDVDGGRVTGTFWVLLPSERARRQDVSLVTVDVTVWDDEHHHAGRMLYSRDLTAFIEEDGEVHIPEHMIREQVRYDVLDAMDAMKVAVRLAADAAIRPEADR